MSETGLAAFDKSIQETNLWPKSVMRYLETDDKELALAALRATLHALRDRIGPENAAGRPGGVTGGVGSPARRQWRGVKPRS